MTDNKFKGKKENEKYTLAMVDKSLYEISYMTPISLDELNALEERTPFPEKVAYQDSESFVYFYEKAKDEFGEGVNDFVKKLKQDLDNSYVLLIEGDNPGDISKEELKNINVLLEEIKEWFPI